MSCAQSTRFSRETLCGEKAEESKADSIQRKGWRRSRERGGTRKARKPPLQRQDGARKERRYICKAKGKKKEISIPYPAS
jgi:hypothetical protein